MTIEEAIKRYNINAEYERTHGSLQGCLEFRQLTDWLKELKQLREQTRWIPVSERLPVHNDVYLVALNMVGYPVRDIDGFVVQEQMWERYGKKVLAWMPLPEPYKQEVEG